MRRIGNLGSESLATDFLEYLRSQSIDAVTIPDERIDDCWEIWVRDESSVAGAKQDLALFVADPASSRFQLPASVPDDAAHADSVLSAQPERDRATDALSHQQRRDRLRVSSDARRGDLDDSAGGDSAGGDRGDDDSVFEVARQQQFPVTIAIILLSVVISFTTNFGTPRGSAIPGEVTLEQKVYRTLSLVDREQFAQSDGDPFASIRRGEVWRALTPMFLHGDMFHLAFNMMWIFYLGSAIERLHGSVFFFVLTVICQIGGAAMQVGLPAWEWLPASMQPTPFSIGASGAVYGMLGFLWIRPMVDAKYPIDLDQTTVMLMLGWLVLCMTPLIPRVANGAHVGGMLAGMLIAVSAIWLKRS